MNSVTTSRQSSMIVALVPWVLFSVLANSADDVKLASILALIASVIVAAPAVLAGRPKILELGAVAAFALITVTAFSVTPDVAGDLARYGRGIAAGMLALIAFASLLFVPFTEQYARESVPAEYWGSPRFKAVNRRLTAMWAGVFAAMVPLHVIAGTVDTQRSNLIFNWVLPVLLVLWALKRTDQVEHAGTPVAA
jgi:hypothetical protein